MPHALTAHFCERYLNAALFADQTLVLHALILAAQALVVLYRTEDPSTEEAVPFRLERTVIDRLRLFDLTERPAHDVIRRSDGDLDLIKRRDRRLRLEEVGNLVHRLSPADQAGGAIPRS